MAKRKKKKAKSKKKTARKPKNPRRTIEDTFDPDELEELENELEDDFTEPNDEPETDDEDEGEEETAVSTPLHREDVLEFATQLNNDGTPVYGAVSRHGQFLGQIDFPFTIHLKM